MLALFLRLVHFIHRDRIGWGMALKKTSEPFVISTSIDESAANTFTQKTVDVNLNPLDQEILMIHSIDIDGFAPDVVTGNNTAVSVSVSTTSRTTIGDISDNNTLGAQRIDVKTDGVNHVVFDRLSAVEPQSGDIPYVGLLATSDFFLQVQGINNTGAKGANVRLFVQRARADPATYASLVQSQLLSE